MRARCGTFALIEPGGEGVYFLPLGGVSEAHYAHAARTLQGFDVVLTTESLAAHAAVVLKRGFGWARNKARADSTSLSALARARLTLQRPATPRERGREFEWEKV